MLNIMLIRKRVYHFVQVGIITINICTHITKVFIKKSFYANIHSVQCVKKSIDNDLLYIRL